MAWQPSLYDEQQFGSFIASAPAANQDPEYAKKVTTYFLKHLKPITPRENFLTKAHISST
jgi:hypothetical protein